MKVLQEMDKVFKSIISKRENKEYVVALFETLEEKARNFKDIVF